jgi:hypothetical protein
MKKNDKYYTPEINEFYIGFKYEVKVGKDINNLFWNKAELKYLNSDWMNVEYRGKAPNQIKIVTVPDCVRVKYLDKKDIESLGWEMLNVKFKME